MGLGCQGLGFGVSKFNHFGCTHTTYIHTYIHTYICMCAYVYNVYTYMCIWKYVALRVEIFRFRAQDNSKSEAVGKSVARLRIVLGGPGQLQ